jgi:hypothetical protein
MKVLRTRWIMLGCLLGNLTAQEVSQPFNGKDLTGWKSKSQGEHTSKWTVGKALQSATHPDQLEMTVPGTELINLAAGHGQSLDLYTTAQFGDVRIELELMVPKGSNSGVYVMGEYEVQVLDSYGKPNAELGAGDIGAIYNAAVPKENASKPPGTWQQLVIDFRAPTFDAEGKKLTNATFVKVTLNGKVLHENLPMPGPTPGGVAGKEAAVGPLMFQGNHGPVAFRNIKITPLAK